MEYNIRRQNEVRPRSNPRPWRRRESLLAAKNEEIRALKLENGELKKKLEDCEKSSTFPPTIQPPFPTHSAMKDRSFIPERTRVNRTNEAGDCGNAIRTQCLHAKALAIETEKNNSLEIAIATTFLFDDDQMKIYDQIKDEEESRQWLFMRLQEYRRGGVELYKVLSDESKNIRENKDRDWRIPRPFPQMNAVEWQDLWRSYMRGYSDGHTIASEEHETLALRQKNEILVSQEGDQGHVRKVEQDKTAISNHE